MRFMIVGVDGTYAYSNTSVLDAENQLRSNGSEPTTTATVYSVHDSHAGGPAGAHAAAPKVAVKTPTKR